MQFSRFEPRGRLKQQIRFRRPFFQQATTAIRQKQPTATPMSAVRPDKPPGDTILKGAQLIGKGIQADPQLQP